jgi:radical SAM protein (TIGR01212 family)
VSLKAANRRVRTLGPLLRQRWGQAVRKVGMRVGASCPNRDGTLGRAGCLFCAERDERPPPTDVASLIAPALREPGPPTIAYLQGHSVTQIGAERLGTLLDELAGLPRVVAITLGTRPDALPADVLATLARRASSVELWVELGLQTAHDDTLRLIGREHDVACFVRAVGELRARALSVCAHVILGLPCATAEGALVLESCERAAATARLLGKLGVEAVKLHNCHVLRGSRLAALHAAGRFEPPTLDEYLERLIAFLEELPAGVEVHRLVAEARPPELIAPAFTAEKARTLARIHAELERRDVWQGARLPAAPT